MHSGKISLLSLTFVIIFSITAFSQGLFINEFQAINNNTIADEYEEYDDWIEFFNAGDSSINLNSYFVSDDIENPYKWQLSDSSDSLIVAPSSYKLFWADGQPGQGTNHLGFKLSASGEAIILTHKDSIEVIDQIEFDQQYSDVSFGRETDSTDNWVYFSEPTPGSSNNTDPLTEKSELPTISVESGFFNSQIGVELSVNSPYTEIYYTLNSETPTDLNSQKYTEPIIINSTTVVRVLSKRENYLNSEVDSRTYVFEEEPHLPIVFLVTDSYHLWGSSGIYDHRTSDWERPINFEFVDLIKNQRFQSNAGIKIHAGDSRPQQSFRLYARSKYGNKYFEHQFFSQKNITKFRRLVLRNGGNDGIQLTTGSHLRDVIAHKLYFDQNKQNAIAAFEQVNVYINGMYWGIYNLRERQDEFYVQENYSYDGELDLLERAFGFPNNQNAINGDWQQYDEMRNFIIDNDLSEDDNYEYIKEKMDIQGFTSYWITEVFCGNFDWLSNNIKIFKPRTGDYKWKWIMWDMDHGLGLPLQIYGMPDWNTLSWATGTSGDRVWEGNNTAIIRNLLENETFKNGFINYFADQLNTTFSTNNVHRLIEKYSSTIEPDVNKHFDRWTKNNYKNWLASLDAINDYASKRPDFVKGHIQEKFDLPGIYALNLEINDQEQGSIKLNTLTIEDSSWSGDYFSDIPIIINPLPKKGHLFDYWQQGTNIITTDTLELANPDSIPFRLFFRADTIPEIVINEINYNSNDMYDSGDWIELYNIKGFDADLSGWVIQDGDSSHALSIPEGTVIDEKGFLVIFRDSINFFDQNPDIQNSIGGLDFGFSSKGDQVRLFRKNGLLMDSLEYDDEKPWPEEADGDGYTLELINPILDNTLAESWKASLSIGGTPGYENSVITGITDKNNNKPYSFRLMQNYPNPFNAITKIEYSVIKNENVKILVFNTQGRLVEVLLNKYHNPGEYTISWNANKLSSGFYYIQLSGKNKTRIIKTILIK